VSVIHLWRGHHGAEFLRLFDRCWASGELLIACPPTELDAAFLNALPAGDIRLAGDWPDLGALPGREAAPEYPERPVLGVFTTGTTRAAQKLVLYSRANVESSQDAIYALYDERRIDTIFCYPQPYHVFGLLLGFALARLRDLRIVFAEGPYGRRSHAAWLEQTSHAMLTLATPSHLRDLCAYVTAQGATPRATYSCILGGARVDVDDWRAARQVARIEYPSIGYGCTEASPGICHLPPGSPPLCDGDVGWPLRQAQLDFSPGDGFLLRGPSLCLAAIEGGVAAFPEAHLVRDELAPLDATGRLAYRGRIDMVLNRGGEKFPLEQIESLLKARHDLDAICVAVPDQRLGAELGIVARARSGVAPAAIFATLREAFKRPFNPEHLRFVDELPLNPSAKPDRKAAARLIDPAGGA
jgi:3-phosphoshikimate 1-carboxyvinyltransferase